MATPVTLNFGWLPISFDVEIGSLIVSTLPGLDAKVRAVRDSEGVEKDWVYPPLQTLHRFGVGARTLPYTNRIFGLPKTHELIHRAVSSDIRN